jgi:hypothetical protein
MYACTRNARRRQRFRCRAADTSWSPSNGCSNRTPRGEQNNLKIRPRKNLQAPLTELRPGKCYFLVSSEAASWTAQNSCFSAYTASWTEQNSERQYHRWTYTASWTEQYPSLLATSWKRIIAFCSLKVFLSCYICYHVWRGDELSALD